MIFNKILFKHLREARGLTQEEVARHVGVSIQAVSKWENVNELSQPRSKRIYKIAEILQISPYKISDLKPNEEDSFISAIAQKGANELDAAIIQYLNSPENAELKQELLRKAIASLMNKSRNYEISKARAEGEYLRAKYESEQAERLEK